MAESRVKFMDRLAAPGPSFAARLLGFYLLVMGAVSLGISLCVVILGLAGIGGFRDMLMQAPLRGGLGIITALIMLALARALAWQRRWAYPVSFALFAMALLGSLSRPGDHVTDRIVFLVGVVLALQATVATYRRRSS